MLRFDAGAAVYEDFNRAGINTGRWTVFSEPAGLFSQPGDGRLHFDPSSIFNRTTGRAKLTSTASFGPGFFSLDFQEFNSDNLEPPGSQRGAFIGLGLTDGTNWVRIIRNQNGQDGQPLGVFEVNYNIGTAIQVHYLETGVTRGRLGLLYDGRKVTFYYDRGSGWLNTGWKTPGQTGEWVGEWAPGWASKVKAYIQGYDEYGRTSALLDNLTYEPFFFIYLPLIRDQL